MMGRRCGPRDEGVALVTVIGLAAALTIFVTTALSVSLGSLVQARTDQDWNGAMAAAYAGIDDYKIKIANDPTYVQYGNPDSPFSASSEAAGTIALPPAANLAFGLGTTGSWATIPGGGAASYRYEVDNSRYWSSGVLRLQSTGRVGKHTRTIVVNLRQPGFLDYLYFSNYEIPDPALTSSPPTCVKYRWQGRPDSCTPVEFADGDVINGPLHSNDTLLSCSATFNGPVTTAQPVIPANPLLYVKASGCSDPTFAVPGSPASTPVILMPQSNIAMKDETRTDLPDLVPRPGCLYTGPTKIVFNPDGTMTVRSPWTKFTQVIGSPATGGANPTDCGKPGDPTKNAAGNSDSLASAQGQTITVPATNLVYVQNVPSRLSNPNSWPTLSAPPGLSCTGGSGSTGAGNGIGYPMEKEYAPTAIGGTQAYGCRNGDAFVEGQLHGAVTVSAENYLYITRDITYVDPEADILGLVAGNAVSVWNPMSCTSKSRSDIGCLSICNGNCSCNGNGTGAGDGQANGCNAVYVPLLADSASGRTIDAAILSVQHTFLVQNYDKGTQRGVLTVNGAIAQNFRGPVTATGAAAGTTGYTQNYTYDQRFRTIAPPRFLLPASTTFGVRTQAEVGTAFKADGSPH